MAERFARGGRLIAVGGRPAARSDVRHVAVEFVHPVIVGKRALPAIGLAAEGGPLELQLDLVAEPGDIVIAFGDEARVARSRAAERGCLTIAFAAGRAPSGSSTRPRPTRSCARSSSRRSTTCCGSTCTCSSTIAACSRGATRGASHDTGASSFLYPFLAEQETDLDAVLADVRESVLMKAAEVGELRAQTLTDNREALPALRRRCAPASTRAAS